MLACSAALLFSCQDKTQNIKIDINKTETAMEKQNIYQFKVEDLSGNTFDFSTLKGKKVMIVNTASKCGLTPQYKDLEAIYKEYKDQNFVIIGFPANNFGSQEPGTNEEIASFANKIMGYFSMMDKVSVKEVICAQCINS
jgi:glutathione peroxidase